MIRENSASPPAKEKPDGGREARVREGFIYSHHPIPIGRADFYALD